MGLEKADEVSLYSWWQNLWKGGSPGRRKRSSHGTDTTIDYPTSAATSPGLGGPNVHAAGQLLLRFGVVSTVGTVREHNEDNYYVPTRTLTVQAAGVGGGGTGGGGNSSAGSQFPVGPPGLFVVADGMGGQQAGEKASSMAVEQIPRELQNRLSGSSIDDQGTVKAIKEAVASANRDILSLSSLETEFSNMGTTVVLALFQRDRVFVTGIGDSRAYRFRESKLEQLTRDHSLADALGEAGTIAREEVPTHKFKNVLYLYLGSKDARDGPEDVRAMDLCAGDRFLLATDGLTGVVRDDRIAEVLRTTDDPQRAAQMLVDEALENLSKDNITCVVIHVDKV